MTPFSTLLKALVNSKAEFILIGGVAANLHGAERTTLDLDLLYRRHPRNHQRIVEALAPFDPYPRGAPPGLPFKFDAATIDAGGNFTLRTTAGAIDLLASIAGGDFDSLVGESARFDLFESECRVLNLPTLIRVKRLAGRPKDFEAIAELELIADELRE